MKRLFSDDADNMSKRFFAACMAMQGFMANPTINFKDNSLIILVKAAYQVSDELLKQEENDLGENE